MPNGVQLFRRIGKILVSSDSPHMGLIIKSLRNKTTILYVKSVYNPNASFPSQMVYFEHPVLEQIDLTSMPIINILSSQHEKYIPEYKLAIDFKDEKDKSAINVTAVRKKDQSFWRFLT